VLSSHHDFGQYDKHGQITTNILGAAASNDGWCWTISSKGTKWKVNFSLAHLIREELRLTSCHKSKTDLLSVL